MGLAWGITIMGSMAINRFYSGIGLILGLYCVNVAHAIEFQFQPSLTFQETYSDNIQLAPKGQQQGAFVTDISPGLSIRGINGGRLSANLNYRLQNLFNSGGDSSTRINHQLQLNTGYQVVRNRFNIAARSNISQQNISNLKNGDNINGANNRTNVYTVGMSANWTPNFNNFANAVVNVDFGYVANDSAQTLSNAMNLTESVTLVSGRDFKHVTWSANFNNTNNYRDNADNVQFQNTSGTLRGWVNRRFNFFATLGYANNNFQNSGPSSNGVSYTAGAQWIPNKFFNMQAGYGNNWNVNANFTPTRQTSMGIGYIDRSVGLNTGGAWNANFTHRRLRSTWRFNYLEDTTTVQQILSQNTSITIVDSNGNPLLNSTGQPLTVTVPLASLTNDVLSRKKADVSVSYRTGKSTFQIGSFFSRRDYKYSNNGVETVYSANASWNWFFTRRTSLYISPSWQKIDRKNSNTGDYKQQRYQGILRVTRTIPLNIGRYKVLNGSLEYRFLKQNSNVIANSYMENRITASLFMNF